jgi:hypothetical protein
MHTILKTNDPVMLDYAQALLRDVEIPAVVFDAEASIMDGSMGMMPRRLMVEDGDAARARAVLGEGLGEDKLEP